MNLRIVLQTFIVVYTIALANANATASCREQDSCTPESLIQKSIQYLQTTQVKETDGQNQFRGEWESYMYNHRSTPFRLLGKKNYGAYDSNCFVPMSIHNILAKVYLDYGYKDNTLVTMMNESMLATQGCYNKGEFNFWHEVYWGESADTKYADKFDIKRRNPNHFNLRKKWFYNIANVVNDADDTSTGFMTLALNEQVNAQSGITPIIPKPEKIGPYFEKWVDKDRSNIHMYDVLRFRPTHTGAFLTWFGRENILPGPHAFIVKNKEEPSIPLKANEVDCIVNANVLSALASYNELESTAAVKNSCDYMNKVAKSKHHRKYCGTYYPNELNVPYAYSKAYAAGATCLEDSKHHLTKLILSRQSLDGSFKGFKDNRDALHSTIFAVTALINYSGQEMSPQIRTAIENGIQYIVSNAVIDESGAHWDAGIFFSAGTVARNAIYWESAPYTTALVIELLVKAKHYGII